MTEPTHQIRGTILVVEDDRQYWEYFKRVLEPVGFRLEWVRHPGEGLAAYERTQPEVVLLDLYFEESSPKASFALLSALRERDAYTKVIVVTASVDQADALEAIDRGATDFVRKGSGMKPDLLFRVKAVLERSKLEDEVRQRRMDEAKGVGGSPCAETILPARSSLDPEVPVSAESDNQVVSVMAGATVPGQVIPYKDACMAFENWYVDKVCNMTGGNQTQASRLLEVDRNTIRRILNRKPAIDLLNDIIPAKNSNR